MATAPYSSFNPSLPDTTLNTTRQAQLDAVRRNFQALRHWLGTFGGKIPGFTSAPLNGAKQYMDGVLHTQIGGTEQVKAVWTWSANRVVKVAYYWSSDAGNSWVPLTDPNGNYVITITYNGSGYWSGSTDGAVP